MTGPTTSGGTVGITAVKRHTDPNGLTRGPTTTAVGQSALTAAPAATTSPGSNASNEMGFSAATGYLTGTADTASTLTHLGARDYDPALGIFISPDPILSLSEARNFSPYLYANGDPVNSSDPSGLKPTCDCADDGIHYAPQPGAAASLQKAYQNRGNVKPFPSFLRPAPAPSLPWSLPRPNQKSPSFTFPAVRTPARTPNNNSVYDLGWQWLTGSGQWVSSFGKPHQTFSDGDPFTEDLRAHPFYRKATTRIAGEIPNGTFSNETLRFNLSGTDALETFVNDVGTIASGGANGGNLSTAFLGSHETDVTSLGSNPDGSTRVQFTATNSTTLQSAVRIPVIGYTDVYRNTIGATQDAFSYLTGIGAKATQRITWTENLR